MIQIGAAQLVPNTVACLGLQLQGILGVITQEYPDLIWYVADINAVQVMPDDITRSDPAPKYIGSKERIIDFAGLFDQFLTGVFLAVPMESHTRMPNQMYVTEDLPFRKIDPAVLEIRAFDTSYFEIYSTEKHILTRLSLVYHVSIIHQKST